MGINEDRGSKVTSIVSKWSADSSKQSPWTVHVEGTDISHRLTLDFSRRYSKLLAGPFRHESTTLALAILASGSKGSKVVMDSLTDHDRARLEAYSRNLVDHHLITDLLPRLAEQYFFSPEDKRVSLSALQQALLVGLGLQLKTVDAMSLETSLPVSQLLAMLNKAIRKFVMVPVEQRKAAPEDVDEGADDRFDGVSPANLKSGTIVSVPSSNQQTSSLPSKAEEPKAKKSTPGKMLSRGTARKSFSRQSDKKHKRG